MRKDEGPEGRARSCNNANRRSSRSRERLYPLTPTQRDLYLDAVLQEDPCVYNLGFLLPLGSDLRPGLWQDAVSLVVNHDPLFRVRIVEERGEVGQIVDPSVTVPNHFVDLSHAAAQSSTPEMLVEAQRREPFDLARGPLFRALLYRQGSGQYHAGLVTSHLVFDGFSAKEFFQRLSSVYGQLAKGKDPTTVAAPSFFQYLGDEVPRFDTPECLEHWTRVCRGLTAPVIDKDHEVSGNEQNAVSRLTLDASEVLAAKRYCLENRFPLPALILALYGVLVRRYADHQGPLLLGSITGYRPRELLATLGCFYHVLPVLLSGDEERSPLSRLAREMSLSRRNLGSHENVSAMALNQITGNLGTRFFFNYQLASSLKALGKSRATTLFWDHPKDEVHLTLTEVGKELELELRYNPSCFREVRFLERLLQFVRLGCQTDPKTGDLELLLGDERPLVSALNTPKSPGPEPDTLVVELFERQVAERPTQAAVVAEGLSLTYQELDARARVVAQRLRKMGAGPERLVTLALEPSLELVVAILGILKSGAAYVPMDPSLPDRRLKLLLDDVDPVALVTREALAQRVRDAGVATLLLRNTGDLLPSTPSENAFSGHKSHHAAYVIHTSGSTGHPKGVVVTHGNLARLFTSTQPSFGLWPRGCLDPLSLGSLRFLGLGALGSTPLWWQAGSGSRDHSKITT